MAIRILEYENFELFMNIKKIRIFAVFRRSITCPSFRQRRGFTLIETIIYSIFIIMVIGLFADFGVRVGDLRNKVAVMKSVSTAAGAVLDAAALEIRQSAEIIEPPVGATSTSLVFKRTSDGPEFEIVNTDGVVFLNENGGASTELTGDDVVATNLIFSNLSATPRRASIKIDIKTEYRYAGGGIYDYSMELGTTAGQR